jgi:hypothetical protein
MAVESDQSAEKLMKDEWKKSELQKRNGNQLNLTRHKS